MEQTSPTDHSEPLELEIHEDAETDVPFPSLEPYNSDFLNQALRYRLSCLLQLPERADIPAGTIPLNRSYRRVDFRMSTPSADCQRRMRARCETQAPCFDAHLNGVCENEDCAFDHGPLEEDLVQTLEWVGRSISCREGSVCSNLACFLGHVCQNTDCELFGGSTACMLDSSLHFGGLSAHHFVPPATIDAHRGEYLWTLPTGELVPTQARPPENEKPNPLEWFKAHVNTLSPFPMYKRRRHRSRTGSASSQASSTSKASQASWDDDDEFDQVLKAMDSDMDSHATVLEQVIPSIAARILGGARHRAEYNDLKTELQRFKDAVAGYHGISDKERRMEAGSFSAEYRSLRGECYSQLLDLRRNIISDLDGLTRAVRAEGPQSDKIFQLRRRLESHNRTLSDMAERMRVSRIEDPDVAVASPTL